MTIWHDSVVLNSENSCVIASSPAKDDMYAESLPFNDLIPTSQID